MSEEEGRGVEIHSHEGGLEECAAEEGGGVSVAVARGDGLAGEIRDRGGDDGGFEGEVEVGEGDFDR